MSRWGSSVVGDPAEVDPAEVDTHNDARRRWSAALQEVLKRHDRIGFGRRGVLDAEEDLCHLAAGLDPAEHRQFCRTVLSWLDWREAERVTAALHYNLPEHLQALAIRLCASVPIAESLPALRRLVAERAFTAPEAAVCREALKESLAQLQEGDRARGR